MRAAAVIVGIDGYEVDPLTGACADACNFRDALLRLPGREYDEPSPLLRYALERHASEDHAVIRLARRIAPSQPWALTLAGANARLADLVEA